MSVPIQAAIDAEIGVRLAEVRRWRGLTQRQLAKAVGVTITAIQNWERGRHAISAKRLGPLADALYCQPLDLLMLPGADRGRQWGTRKSDQGQKKPRTRRGFKVR